MEQCERWLEGSSLLILIFFILFVCYHQLGKCLLTSAPDAKKTKVWILAFNVVIRTISFVVTLQIIFSSDILQGVTLNCFWQNALYFQFAANIALMLAEMFWTPEMRYDMWAHHVCFVIASGIFLDPTLGSRQDQKYFLYALMYAFQVGNFAAINCFSLIIYHMSEDLRTKMNMFRIVFWVKLISVICCFPVIVILIYYTARGYTTAGNSVIGIVLILIIMSIEIYVATIAWKIKTKKENQLRNQQEPTALEHMLDEAEIRGFAETKYLEHVAELQDFAEACATLCAMNDVDKHGMIDGTHIGILAARLMDSPHMEEKQTTTRRLSRRTSKSSLSKRKSRIGSAFSLFAFEDLKQLENLDDAINAHTEVQFLQTQPKQTTEVGEAHE